MASRAVRRSNSGMATMRSVAGVTSPAAWEAVIVGSCRCGGGRIAAGRRRDCCGGGAGRCAAGSRWCRSRRAAMASRVSSVVSSRPGRLGAYPLHVAARRLPHLGGEQPGEVALRETRRPGHGTHPVVTPGVGVHPGLGVAHGSPGGPGATPAWRTGSDLRPVHEHHQPPGDQLGTSAPRSSSTRASDRSIPAVTPALDHTAAVPHVNRVGVDDDVRVGTGEFLRPRPMGRHPCPRRAVPPRAPRNAPEHTVATRRARRAASRHPADQPASSTAAATPPPPGRSRVSIGSGWRQWPGREGQPALARHRATVGRPPGVRRRSPLPPTGPGRPGPRRRTPRRTRPRRGPARRGRRR